MTRHAIRPKKEYTRILKNQNGRLSPCVCCCELPPTLWGHIQPTFNDGTGENDDCVREDQGQLANDGAYPLSGGLVVSHCQDWESDNSNPGGGEPEPVCWGGMQAQPFGAEMRLYCIPVNQIRLDICWGAFGTGHPSSWPGDCDLLQEGLIPISLKACTAGPGEFFADFGNFTPPGCVCSFHIWVDEVPGNVIETAHPYEYPEQSAAALPHGLRRMLTAFEQTPGIGTPPSDVSEEFV